MPQWFQTVIQVLIAILGVLAGAFTLLTAMTRLIRAIIELIKEIRESRDPPHSSSVEGNKTDPPSTPMEPNGAAKDGSVSHRAGKMVRGVGRSITLSKPQYIEVTLPNQDAKVETNKENTKG